MNNEDESNLPEGIPEDMTIGSALEEDGIDMKEVVGTHDILFICLDTLRYDVATEEETKGTTPVLNRYGKWTKCFAPANFTYPSHHAMFAGFMPPPVTARSISDRNMLFFPKNIGMGKLVPPKAFAFEGANFIEGLAYVGYTTLCIGGVAFFDKRSPIGSVFPNMFQQSYWRPSFGCGVKDSAKNQIDFGLKKLKEIDSDKRVFMYINICAIHYPNYFYLSENRRKDDVKSHGAALRYVDKELERL